MTEPKAKKPLRLLLVEDSEDDALLLMRELSRTDYDVTHERVDTPEAMKAALDREKWDVVVCDYVMPKFNALEALALLKRTGHDLPFLIVSGTIGEETAVQAMKAGAHDYLMKGKLLRLLPAIERELREAKMRAQRAETEQALYQSEEKFRFMFEHSSVPMWVADKETQSILEVNEAAVSCYGYSRREFLKMKTSDLLTKQPAEEPPVFPGHRGVREEKHRIKNGQIIEVEIHSDTLEINGSKFTLGIAQDITARKQTERELIMAREAALEASQLKSDFLANVSHEIRTPLNGIVGMTEILERTKLSKQQKEGLEIIKLSADSLLSTVNDVLDFSKIESGKLELNIADFNPVTIIKETMKLFSFAAKKKGIGFDAELPADLPALLQGDVTRIKQVLQNLLDNAIKFTEKGKVIVRVEKMKEEMDRVTLRISVLDSGIGIPMEAHGRIFKPFSQADSSLTRKYGGTGLGLAISKRLVELMNGEIGFESKPGDGANFWLQIEFNKSTSKNIRTPDPDSIHLHNGKKKSDPSPQILVVEDNPINQKVIMEMLKRIGCKAQGVGNGQDALQMLGKTPYDLILMDCQMSDMDGFKTTDLIRQAEKSNGGHTTIIALTAHAFKGYREKCLKAGMDDYISKPVDFKILSTTIEKWLSS